MALPKLEEIIGEIDADKLITAVTTYDGWKDAMKREGLERIKFDSKDTKTIDASFQKLPNPKNSAYNLPEIQARVTALQELSNLTLAWLEDKVSSHTLEDLKSNPRFKVMLALNISVNSQLKNALEIQSQLQSQYATIPKENTFFNTHRMFAPPGEKIHPPPLPPPHQDNLLTLEIHKALDNFAREIGGDWNFENPVLTTLTDDIANFKKTIDPKNEAANNTKLIEDFVGKLGQYQAAANKFELPDTAVTIEKYKQIIIDLKEIYGESQAPRKRS